MKRVLACILSLIMVLSLAACVGDNKTTTAAPGQSTAAPAQTTAAPGQSTAAPVQTTAAPVQTTAEPVAKDPKILKMYATMAPANAWLVVTDTQASAELLAYLAGTLYATMPIDGKAVLGPQLAASEPVDVNGDGKTWNIAISPDAKWENGEAITADTFLYTFRMALDPKLVFANASGVGNDTITVENALEYYQQGSSDKAVSWDDVGFKKVDDMTIQVISKTKVNKELVMRHFSSKRTTPIYEPLFEQCLSEDKTSSTYGSTADKIMSSGPFKAGNWVDGAVYELLKNENFIREDLVKLDGVTITVVEDAGTRLQMFENGELDYVTLNAAGRDAYGDDPRILVIPGRRVYSIEYNGANTENPLVTNENFHLALFYGTNRVEMGKLIAQEPATGLISPTSIATVDGTSFRALAAKAGYEPKNNGYDPEKAKQYFEAALKETGLTKAEVTVLCNTTMVNRVEYLQESWTTLFGADRFKMNINSQPSAQAGDLRKGWKTNPNSYELTFTQWNLSSGDYDPITALRGYTTTYSGRYAPYDDEKVNAWYAEANEGDNRLNMDKRNALAMEIEKYMLEHAMVNPFTYETTYCIASDRVVMALGEYNTDLGFGWTYADIDQ